MLMNVLAFKTHLTSNIIIKREIYIKLAIFHVLFA